MLSQESHSIPAQYLWECEKGYMDWFLGITYLYVHVSTLRTTSRRISYTHEKDLAKLVRTCALINLFSILDFNIISNCECNCEMQ